MGWLIGIAAKMLGERLAARWAKPLAYLLALLGFVAAIALAIGAWHLWLRSHDRGVVAADRARTSAALDNRQLEVERQIGADKRARDDAFADQQSNLQEAADAPLTDDNRTALDALGDRMRDH